MFKELTLYLLSTFVPFHIPTWLLHLKKEKLTTVPPPAHFSPMKVRFWNCIIVNPIMLLLRWYKMAKFNSKKTRKLWRQLKTEKFFVNEEKCLVGLALITITFLYTVKMHNFRRTFLESFLNFRKSVISRLWRQNIGTAGHPSHLTVTKS